MRFGPAYWKWVTTDTAGVPHGGKFGDVPRFEAVFRRHNLYVGWSRIQRCFGIATRDRRNGWQCQMLLTTGRSPIALSSQLVGMLLTLWAQRGRHSCKSLVQMAAQQESDRNSAEAKADYDRQQDRVKEIYARLRHQDRSRIMVPISGLRRAVG